MGDEGRTIDNVLERAMIDVAREHHAHDAHAGHDVHDEHHGGEIVEEAAAAEAHRAPAHAGEPPHDDAHGHAHAPHEMPLWPMNLPLVILAAGSILGGLFFYQFSFGEGYGWIKHLLIHSTQVMNPYAEGAYAHHAYILGMDAHLFMAILSGLLAVLSIAAAAYFHWYNRHASARVATMAAPLVKLLRGKWYVDEAYDRGIVKPLRTLSHVLYGFDQLVINGLVLTIGRGPGIIGEAIRPLQSGKLQGYGVGMATGVGVILAVLFWTLMS